jgi:uncharacterized protein YbjT (DUF2867 family)
MSAKILITGATGNVGAEVAKALLAAGAAVRAGDIDPQRARPRLGVDENGRLETIHFRFGEAGSYPAAFAGIERVFLMRPPQISDVQKYILPAIDAARTAGVRQFVFLSLIGIEHNQRVPHYAVEQYLRKLDVDYTFLRASFFMQNLNTTHRAEIRERSEIYIPAGRARTSFIDARDIGAVAARVLAEGQGHARAAYDLTGGEALDYYQAAELFSAVLGRPVRYRSPSTLAYLQRQLRAGTPLLFALITAWLYRETRRGMAATVTGEVERLLGRKPISLHQYIQDYQDCWK